MKWIRPLHDEQTTETNSELITPISQIVNTHGFHPFYRSLVEENITRLKGVGRVVLCAFRLGRCQFQSCALRKLEGSPVL